MPRIIPPVRRYTDHYYDDYYIGIKYRPSSSCLHKFAAICCHTVPDFCTTAVSCARRYPDYDPYDEYYGIRYRRSCLQKFATSCRHTVPNFCIYAVSLVADALDFYTKPIQRSCSYVFYYKRYVKQLEPGLRKLCATRAVLRREVEIAKTQKKSISPEVESWLAEVDAIEEATKRFISDAESRMHCEPTARYSLSHKSVEMLRQLLEREREGNEFRKVADPAPPPRIGSTFVRVLNPEFS